MTPVPERQQSVIVIAATVLFGLSLLPGLSSSLGVVAGTVALGVAIFTSRGRPSMANAKRSEVALLVAILVFAGVTALGWSRAYVGRTIDTLDAVTGLVWAALAAFAYLRGEHILRLTRGTVIATAIAFTCVTGAIHIGATDGAGLDVLSLHIEAAEALGDGLNPYTDAVTVDDGAPTASAGDVIEGYLYPPITAVLYALGQWIFSDPRYVSLMAWAVYLMVLGLSAVRSGGRASLLTFLLMASLPGWPVVLRAAWTEPVSLGLAALAFASWHRPVVSGVFLGCALGSKQYFFVAAPLLALYRGIGWLRRAVWALLMIVVTVGAALVWDSAAFWGAAVEFHMTTPPRPDSQNVVGLFAALGLDWDLPTLLPIATGLVAAGAAGFRARTRTQWFLALAFTLAVSFVVSSQAFTNYWFLIAGLCGIALLGKGTHQAVTPPSLTETHDSTVTHPSRGPSDDRYFLSK